MFKDREGWRVHWREPNGRRRSKYFPDKAEARRFEIELELGIADKSSALGLTFESFAKRWLAEYSKVEKRPTSHAEDRRVVDRHLVPALGQRTLGTLRKADLLELKASLLTKTAKGKETPLNPKSVNNVLMVAKKLLGYAVDLDLIQENPWTRVKPVKLAARDFDYWRPSERDEFYERSRVHSPDLADLVLLACHTGLRKGELAALQWPAVDLERRKLRVAASYNVGLDLVTPTKGGEVADVPLNAVALALLKRRSDRKAGTVVFPPALFKNLRRDFGSLCERIGVRPIRFHDTRHTFASCLAMAGVDLLVIQQLVRHKSYQMTLRYAHLHPNHLAGATDCLVTQVSRKPGRETSENRNLATSKRARRDSNSRPSGSKLASA